MVERQERQSIQRMPSHPEWRAPWVVRGHPAPVNPTSLTHLDDKGQHRQKSACRCRTIDVFSIVQLCASQPMYTWLAAAVPPRALLDDHLIGGASAKHLG